MHASGDHQSRQLFLEGFLLTRPRRPLRTVGWAPLPLNLGFFSIHILPPSRLLIPSGGAPHSPDAALPISLLSPILPCSLK